MKSISVVWLAYRLLCVRDVQFGEVCWTETRGIQIYHVKYYFHYTHALLVTVTIFFGIAVTFICIIIKNSE